MNDLFSFQTIYTEFGLRHCNVFRMHFLKVINRVLIIADIASRLHISQTVCSFSRSDSIRSKLLIIILFSLASLLIKKYDDKTVVILFVVPSVILER